jgi:M6 family metalloprotease-like protein
LTFEGHRAYIEEAIAISDADVDYSEYQVVFVVASKDAAIPESPAFHAYPGRGIAVDKTEVRRAATFGSDIRDPGRNRASHILIHELGHLLGLPDLHDWQSFGLLNRKHVGGWDVMSSINTGGHFLAWHMWKLGWLDPNQILCVLGSFETIEETITPLETRGGLKAVFIPVSASRAYIVEVRQKIGVDTDLCDSGVLIYSVDANARNGTGPIRVSSLNGGKDFEKIKKCDVLYDAPFDVGPAEIASFDDADANLTIEVISRSESSYKVRIRRTNPPNP